MKKPRRDPWTKDPFDPLELLARLGGRCAQRFPALAPAGKGQPITDAHLDAALGMMADGFAANLALAVATRNSMMIGELVQQLFEPAMRHLKHEQRAHGLDLDAGENRHRVRMVLVDAVRWLIYPELRVPARVAARTAKMRLSTYVAVYRRIDSMLHAALDNARADLRDQLYS